jgi:hypothetical protein
MVGVFAFSFTLSRLPNLIERKGGFTRRETAPKKSDGTYRQKAYQMLRIMSTFDAEAEGIKNTTTDGPSRMMDQVSTINNILSKDETRPYYVCTIGKT